MVHQFPLSAGGGSLVVISISIVPSGAITYSRISVGNGRVSLVIVFRLSGEKPASEKVTGENRVSIREHREAAGTSGRTGYRHQLTH